jgi:hypothetical protein
VAEQACKRLAPERGFELNLKRLGMPANATPKSTADATQKLLAAARTSGKNMWVWRTPVSADAAMLLLHCVSRHKFVTNTAYFQAVPFPGRSAPSTLRHPVC